MHAVVRTLAIAIALAAAPSAQLSQERQRARPHYLSAWQLMRVEAWADAEKAFRQAIDVDAEFEDAYYGLGRAQMAQRRFAEAIVSYTRCRDLYRAAAGRRFSNQQDAQRYRRDRMMELDEVLRQYNLGPQTMQTQNRIRQLQEQRRQLQDSLDRGTNISVDQTVPAFVSLALGSAYFRSGKLTDAEREYKVAIDADPRAGEAHSNLAVVYFETGRYADAERAVAAAERAGHKVHPQLKQDIKDRRKGT